MEQIVGALAFAVRCERERGLRAPPSSRNQEPVRDRDRDRPFNNKRPCNNNVNNGESERKFAKAIIGSVRSWERWRLVGRRDGGRAGR